MRNIIVIAVAFLAGTAGAQTTTTCIPAGSTVRCTTSPDAAWQNQQYLNQGALSLGRAIAARRERKRQERAIADAAAVRAAGVAAVQAALDADTATLLPPPTDEQPVLLACKLGINSVSLALYEMHSRVDVSAEGGDKTRQANFSTGAVSWVTPLARFTLNRIDGTYTAEGNIPELAGDVVSGTCALASERKF